MTRGSIIIVSWNGEAYLGSCLNAVLAQTSSDDEVIVVDNGSTDGSVTLVRERYPRVHLIENGRNLGFAGGCNTGLRAAQGDVLFMVNQDAALWDGWLEVMCEAIADCTVGVVGCKLLYPDGQTIQHVGGIIRWPRAVPDHWEYGEQDGRLRNEPVDVDYVTGAAWGFRRDIMEQVGELDEGYWPGYYEEVDYCFRAREAGRRVVYVPAAQATHIESTTLGQGSEAFYRAFHRGRLRFVLKRLSPERFLCDFVPAERSWLKEKLVRRERLAMGQVYLAALMMVPTIYAAREEVGLPSFDVLQQVTEALADLRAEVWSRPSSLQVSGEPGERSLWTRN